MSTEPSIDDAAAPDLVELNDGRMIRIDGLKTSDRQRYLTAAESLSRRTLHLRFLSPISKISDAQVERFLDVGHDGREALIAVSCDTAEIVGVARFAPEPSEGDVVDVGVVVVDAWQFHGIGSCLLDRLIDLARSRGHHVAGAASLVENTAATAMLRARGFKSGAISAGVAEWSLDLTGVTR
jgi:GNAT superfamily N-acetyltransferase